MPVCTFISKHFVFLGILTSALVAPSATFAQDIDMSIPSGEIGGGSSAPGTPLPNSTSPQATFPPASSNANHSLSSPTVPSGAKKEETGGLFDQSSSPYLEYGDFNSSEDEDADTMYFQYGRFFGISVGLGYEAATGNRGYLYQPAFPRFDLKVHYWFDFQFALNLGVFFANHTFDYQGANFTAKLIGYEMDLKYYFDVRNAAAALTFSNPFLIGGVGAISKSQTQGTSTQPTTDSTFSASLGAGLEFPISYKKTYLILEGRYYTQSFADNASDSFKNRVPDLTGGFMTVMLHLLFTW